MLASSSSMLCATPQPPPDLNWSAPPSCAHTIRIGLLRLAETPQDQPTLGLDDGRVPGISVITRSTTSPSKRAVSLKLPSIKTVRAPASVKARRAFAGSFPSGSVGRRKASLPWPSGTPSSIAPLCRITRSCVRRSSLTACSSSSSPPSVYAQVMCGLPVRSECSHGPRTSSASCSRTPRSTSMPACSNTTAPPSPREWGP